MDLVLLSLVACREPEPTEPVPEKLLASDLFEAVEVTVDPRVATVLVVDWHQRIDADAVWLEWIADGETGSSPERALAVGEAREWVIGVPSATEVAVTLRARIGGDELALELGSTRTGPLPEFLTDPTLVVPGQPGMRPEPYLLTSVDGGPLPFFGPCFTVLLDARGRVVWYRQTRESRLTWEPRVSEIGGYLLIDEATNYTHLTDDPPSISRVTLDGLRDELVPLEGMSLAYDELADGSFLFSEQQDNVRFYLTRQLPDGTRERLWDCFAWMSAYSTTPYACATNTVDYDPERGTVLWSMYKTHTVVEIDLATGAISRQFGQLPGGYAFDPPDAMIDTQHFPNWSEDGTLMVSTHDAQGLGEQWARELEFDDDTRTVRQVWSLRSDTYAKYAGEVLSEPSGNVLWELGVAGVIQELTPAGEVLWQVQWPDQLVGTVTPIADPYALTVR